MKPIKIVLPKLPGRIGAITLWPFIVYRQGQEKRPELHAHEMHHWNTALRCGILPWYLAYLLLLPFFGGGRNHPLERPAYEEEERVRREIAGN